MDALQELLVEFPEIRIAFGESDEYSFVLHKSTQLYGACVRACVRARVCVCVSVCVCTFFSRCSDLIVSLLVMDIWNASDKAVKL